MKQLLMVPALSSALSSVSAQMFNSKKVTVMGTRKKQKQVSIEEYIETYCQERRMRDRFAIYVSRGTHDNLRKATAIFRDEHYTTALSLADAILASHFKVHKNLLQDALRRYLKEDDHTNNGGDSCEPYENDLESCPNDASEE
jgi:hypothetical protein